MLPVSLNSTVLTFHHTDSWYYNIDSREYWQKGMIYKINLKI